jgi:hypothetical protein
MKRQSRIVSIPLSVPSSFVQKISPGVSFSESLISGYGSPSVNVMPTRSGVTSESALATVTATVLVMVLVLASKPSTLE